MKKKFLLLKNISRGVFVSLGFFLFLGIAQTVCAADLADYDIYESAIQSDGKIIIVGWLDHYNTVARSGIARLNTDGTLDTTFLPGTGTSGDAVRDVVIQSDGKIVIVGEFSTYNGTARSMIARLNADGTLDTAFDPGTGADGWLLSSVALQSDGKILISGDFDDYDGTAIYGLARLNADGSLDTSFNTGTGPNDEIMDIAVQSDGDILIGGPFNAYNGTAAYNIARINSDGSLDTGFTNSSSDAGQVQAIAIQSDGKIIVGGNFWDYNGTGRKHLIRLNSGGSVDTTFNLNFDAWTYINDLFIQADEKVIVGGYFTYDSYNTDNIARLNTDGSIDTGFDPGAGANGVVETVFVQSNGKVIVGGQFDEMNNITMNYITRLATDGTLEETFGEVGSGQESSEPYTSTTDAPIDINVEVQDTLSLDCYESGNGSGDHIVTLSDSVTGAGYTVAGIPSVGRSTCDTTTNDDQGYYLTIERSTEDVTWAGTSGTGTHAASNVLIHEDPNIDDTWYEIPDTTNGLSYYNGSNAIAWTEGTTKGFGFSVITFPDTNTANNTLDEGWTPGATPCIDGSSATTDTAIYAAVPDAAQAIAAVTQYESGPTTTHICYKVDVLPSQQSGQYAGQVTYTATSDASGYHTN